MSTSGGSSGGGSGTVTSVAATDTSIVIAGTPTVAPTVATGTLDVVATQHPPAANWSNNSHKITSLANGSGAQDAAALGQTAPTVASWLARVTYAPASVTTYNLTASLAALDATNLTIGFTAPASGAVVLRAVIHLAATPTAAVGDYVTLFLAFVTHSTTTAVSSYVAALTNQAPVTAVAGNISITGLYEAAVTGLAAGNPYQYDLAGLYAGSSTPATAAAIAGGGTTTGSNWGPAMLYVLAA